MDTSPENKKGVFSENTIRTIVSEDSDNFKPESGRYHLYIAHGCPYAHRAHIVLRLKGLEDHISISVAHSISLPTKPGVDSHIGWVFRNPTDPPVTNSEGKGTYECEGCTPDEVNNAKTVRELYEISGYTEGRFTVPLLWDKKEKLALNNSSADLMRIFGKNFDSFATRNKNLDLYPNELKDKIDEMDQWVQENINGPIGITFGFGNLDQAIYNKSVKTLFDAYDKIEGILANHRYLLGDRLTESDIKLFVWLIRHDEILSSLLKLDKKRIYVDYPNIMNYCRDIYQLEGVKETVNWKHNKYIMFSKANLNPSGIVPSGTYFQDAIQHPHNRHNLNN